MGKKSKVGKSRKDRFYHLAKETGYRSRAAFKLIQLNRKYEFLQTSNVIVDLCAAPGGWLQVATENAPMSNHIIGIDLVPIAPIHNAKTLQEDITTEKCRQALKKELHTAKADCFLNDGAPNVGKNWIHDAYQQAELTLHAMKLATEFLRKGGWFITKLFRSKDYDALMWVFQQLFKLVHATKPQASRNESAEIFVVCQGFLAPHKIDPKFMDPKYVFQEVDKTQRPAIDLIHPEKKKRQREGYPEGDLTMFYSLTATEFFASENFMDLLAESSEIVLNSEEIKNHPLTTAEIKECIKDIKILGKKEIKSIFMWRKKLKKELEKKKDSTVAEAEKADTETVAAVEEDEEEEECGPEEEAEIEELENLLEEQNKEDLRAIKKAKKKVSKAQMKQKTRLDLNMTIPGDQPDIHGDENVFDIRKIRSKMDLAEVEKGDLSHLDTEDIFEESDDENSTAQKRRMEFFDRDEKRYNGVGESDEEEEVMEEEPVFDNEEDESDKEVEEEHVDANPLIIDMGERERVLQDKQTAWFKKSAFADLENDDDEDLELEQMTPSADKAASAKMKKKATQVLGTNSSSNDGRLDQSDSDEDVVVDSAKNSDSDDEDSVNSDYDFTDMHGTAKNAKRKNSKDVKTSIIKTTDGNIEVVPKSTVPTSHLDAEGLAIGAAMVQSRKRRRDIVDLGYHRYMFDDDNLPDWFLLDERKHMKRQRAVTKEEMEEYKVKMKAINDQPIKKIAEAKARKKMKMLKRQEKARKKANSITDNVDTSEKEKWQQIKQIYKKAGLLKKSKPSITYVVAKKGTGKKVRRPAGVKGQFKVVDGRMKKDLKGLKRAENKAKGKKKNVKKKGGNVRK